jgi:hypothetical protein
MTQVNLTEAFSKRVDPREQQKKIDEYEKAVDALRKAEKDFIAAKKAVKLVYHNRGIDLYRTDLA